MHELTKDQAERLNRLNIEINALLESLDGSRGRAIEYQHAETSDAFDLLRKAEKLSASILWGTK